MWKKKCNLIRKKKQDKIHVKSNQIIIKSWRISIEKVFKIATQFTTNFIHLISSLRVRKKNTTETKFATLITGCSSLSWVRKCFNLRCWWILTFIVWTSISSEIVMSSVQIFFSSYGIHKILTCAKIVKYPPSSSSRSTYEKNSVWIHRLISSPKKKHAHFTTSQSEKKHT